MELLKGLHGQQAVIPDLLDSEQTSVGLKAELPQTRQVTQALAEEEVTPAVNGGFGCQRPPFLVVLADACPPCSSHARRG